MNLTREVINEYLGKAVLGTTSSVGFGIPGFSGSIITSDKQYVSFHYNYRDNDTLRNYISIIELTDEQYNSLIEESNKIDLSNKEDRFVRDITERSILIKDDQVISIMNEFDLAKEIRNIIKGVMENEKTK